MPTQPLATNAGVLFDLDGTLLDTAPDMARALNRLRLEHGQPALPFETIRPVVSHGAAGLIQLGFGVSAGDSAFANLRERFLQLYRAALAVDTVLFPGMETLLTRLESNTIPWGIVTNKPGWLTDPLLRQLQLWERAACVISGDTLPQRKPDPAPLLHACQLLGIAPRHCLYVGDAQRDIEAGKRAEMSTLVARFGYISAQDKPENWGATAVLATPAEILLWLERSIFSTTELC